uniref:Integrase core domain-containing protein n=1 Tax=Amphimedon queenslandica TaxID=400682 RepID=A0A1X7TJY3_AMPQE
MTGFLASQSFRCSQIRVGESLKCVHPNYHVQRQRSTARQMNPVPYYASYFGEKLHIDQNEKLAMFGLTHVCAIDGFSGRIVGFSLMPQKNNIVVYEQLYKSVINNYGLWDQIRVDCGREWYLMLFINQMFAHLRTSTTKEPHLQSSSKLNHTIERIWVEVNSRVNYPIKQALMDLVESDLINTEDPIHKYCISWFIIQVASIGTSIFVNSWNEHPIPGHKNGIIRRGVPNVLMKQSSNAKRINPNLLPSSSQAVRIYTSSGGVLTEPYQFGIDPIAHSVEKKSIRHMSFTQKFPSFDNIFHEILMLKRSLSLMMPRL